MGRSINYSLSQLSATVNDVIGTTGYNYFYRTADTPWQRVGENRHVVLAVVMRVQVGCKFFFSHYKAESQLLILWSQIYTQAICIETPSHYRLAITREKGKRGKGGGRGREGEGEGRGERGERERERERENQSVSYSQKLSSTHKISGKRQHRCLQSTAKGH